MGKKKSWSQVREWRKAKLGFGKEREELGLSNAQVSCLQGGTNPFGGGSTSKACFYN